MKNTLLLTSLLLSSSTPAFANAITVDSKAFDLTNSGTTLEVGASYRQFDVKGNRHEARHRTVTKHVPAVYASCGRLITPARDIHVQETYYVTVPFTKELSNTTANAKISRRFGSDFLASVGQDSKPYAGASFKNGSAVLSGSINTHGDYTATLAYSPVKNFALIAHNQKQFTAYGAQVQLGDTSLQVAYAPNVNGLSVGIGQEFYGAKAEPTFNLQPVTEASIETATGTIRINSKVIPQPVVNKPTTIKPSLLPAPCAKGTVKIQQGDSFYCIPTKKIRGRG